MMRLNAARFEKNLSLDPSLAESILDLVYEIRNPLPSAPGRAAAAYRMGRDRHLEKIERTIARGAPIQLVLPAFPAKSPNPEKTLGRLPDFGEVLALSGLEELCRRIGEKHAPGARLVICSDGRVFSDLVLVPDGEVDEYARGIERIIEGFGFERLETYNLEDELGGISYDEMRERLVKRYAVDLSVVRESVLAGGDARTMFNGIHRFVFEDRLVLDSGKSRNRIREESKIIAYEVIRRSNAWSRLVERRFPEALRLSIHPQPVESEKIGVRMIPGDDIWGTPWHGVVLYQGGVPRLVKRAEAERRGATQATARGGYGFYVLGKNEMAP